MHKLAFYIFLVVLGNSCQTKENEKAIINNEVSYDSNLAQQWDADEYGMKTYYWVDLIAGPNRSHSKAATDSIQKGHMNHINAMADNGQLVLAGPFLDDQEVRGIFILNVASKEMADSIVALDPAVQSGRLIMKVRPWYGSAAVMGINEAHQKVAKVNI